MQNLTAQDLYESLEKIRMALGAGKITYDDAKVQAQPYIDEMNNRGRVIAAKYGKKHQPFTFASLMR